jgi:DNA repair exonuclease SbcCD nuclease subunit
MPSTLRVLLLADTHLGLRTRDCGTEAFFRSYERALEPAFRGEVDLVIHGGDVFYRSRIKPSLVVRAFQPLKTLADSGVAVVVTPGNHERSAIPFPLLAAHPHVHIVDRPRTLIIDVRGLRVALAAFPNVRNGIRERFASLLLDTKHDAQPADVRLLCFHQSVEGARVGPADFVFRNHADVIPGRLIPRGFAAVLTGHIHRHQALTSGLDGRPLASPVLYPGSTERTSRAEDGEPKGYVTMNLEADGSIGGQVADWRFHVLSAPLRDTRTPMDPPRFTLATEPGIPIDSSRRDRTSSLYPRT